MDSNIEFNEDHKEVLRELMNVAYGSSAAVIAEILDAFATLRVPKIELFNDEELRKYLLDRVDQDKDAFLCIQGINGKVAGESIFVLNRSSVENLALYFDLDEEASEEDLKDVATELTNILSSSTVGKLAEQVNSSVSFSPPSVSIVNGLSMGDDLKMKNYSQAIVICTSIEFEKEKIHGDLILFMQDQSIVWLKAALDKIISEYL